MAYKSYGKQLLKHRERTNENESSRNTFIEKMKAKAAQQNYEIPEQDEKREQSLSKTEHRDKKKQPYQMDQELHRKLREQEDQIKKLREENRELRHSRYEAKNKFEGKEAQYKQQISDLRHDVERLTAELITSQNKLAAAEKIDVMKENTRILGLLQKERQRTTSLSEQIQVYKMQLKTEHTASLLSEEQQAHRKTQRSLEGTQQELRTLHEKLTALEVQLQEQQNNLTIAQLFTLLNRKLSEDTLDQYSYLDHLNDKVRKLRKRVRIRNQRPVFKRTTIAGHLIEDQFGQLLFQDLNGNLYTNGPSTKGVIVGVPARADIRQGVAYIEHYFHLSEERQHENSISKSTTKPKSDRNVIDKDDLYSLDGVKVLVVAIHDLPKYRDRLLKHRAEVEVHNVIEESDERLEAKAKRSDVILVCTKDIKHRVWHKLDRNDSRVEELETENEDAIAVRARYKAISLNLIRTGFRDIEDV